MNEIVVDTSIWIEFFRHGKPSALEPALRDGRVLLAPIVAAELLSAPISATKRRNLESLLADLPLHPTPLSHWSSVGKLRANCARRGLSVSTPDVHVALCAIEVAGYLWSHGAVFRRMSRCVRALRLVSHD